MDAPLQPDYRHNKIRPDRAPDPVYLGMQEGDDGLLTVLVLVPDRRWKEATRFRRGPHGMDFEWLDLDRPSTPRLKSSTRKAHAC